jgi:hypothetical protein
MLQFHTTTSQFKERPFFKDQEIELMCLDELRKQNLLPPEPKPIHIELFITKRFKITPDYGRSLPEGILGVTKFGEHGPVEMLIARELSEDVSDNSRRRVNSTLAHEAGHCLLHGYLFGIASRKGEKTLKREELKGGDGLDLSDKKVLCRAPENSISGYDGRWWEWQANAMIGPLLMPSPLVQQLLRKKHGIVPPSLLKTKTISQEEYSAIVQNMSEVFDVNPAAAKVRMQKIGFIL